MKEGFYKDKNGDIWHKLLVSTVTGEYKLFKVNKSSIM